MNSHQRRKRACAQHYRMPLGCAVRVHMRDGTYRNGTLSKHDSNACIVNFETHNAESLAANSHASVPFAWINYSRVKPVAVHRVRPWWRVLRERHRLTGK